MNSIRPLFTITILIVVAVYLYLKINESPARPVADGSKLQETAEGVPPLDAIDTNDNAVEAAAEMAEAPSAEGEAPAWNAKAATASPDSTATDDLTSTTLPAVPEIPALPDVAAPSESTLPSNAETLPAQLPDNIPVATYPGEAATNSDSAGGARSASAPGDSVPIVPAENVADETANAAAASSAANAALPGTTSTQSTGAAPLTGRYGDPTDTTNASSPAPLIAQPTAESFAASWPAIQAALDQGELARAHQLLSLWYGKATLAPAEQQQVETLLSQLAGTVVYSTEHQLEPAHVVQPGETLETIAAKYNVPWQLLAKVNGVASVDAVEPGQQLKVMRGPFSAVVNLAKNEVSLSLDGRYAGRFPIDVPADVKASEGEWMVMQKIYAPDGGSERSLLLRPLAPPDSTEPDGVILGAVKLESLGAGIVGGSVVGMSPADSNEIADILSVGSRVMIRR